MWPFVCIITVISTLVNNTLCAQIINIAFMDLVEVPVSWIVATEILFFTYNETCLYFMNM